MLRTLILFYGCLAWTPIVSQTIVINALPDSTPEEDALFLAGNFNRWNAADTAYRFRVSMDGALSWISVPDVGGEMEFKITRGDWSTVECASDGSSIANRTAVLSAGDTLFIQIDSWQDLHPKKPKISTASANVLSVDFDSDYFGQAGRRTLRIYLPPSYDKDEKAYPVLYMMDGQNVFDKATAYSEEWGVDEILDGQTDPALPPLIVVAVDNAGADRIKEYTPWHNSDYGGGGGKAFLEFLVHEVKPWIDARFRTLPQAEHTGLMGSSLGGLMAFYGGMSYPEVFGRLGVFSPSYWINPQVWEWVAGRSVDEALRIYQCVGRLEGEDMTAPALRMKNWLIDRGFSPENLQSVLDEEGRHNELFWRRHFPQAVQFLFVE